LADFKDKIVIFRTSNLPYESSGKGPKLRSTCDQKP